MKQWADTTCPTHHSAILLNEIHAYFLADSLSRVGGSRTKRDLYINNSVALTMQTDSLRKQGIDELHEFVVANAVDTTGSGMNAHYNFAGEEPGNYVLFGEWKIGTYQYAWWAPVTLAAGKPVRRDLDNSAEHHNDIYCGALPDSADNK